MARQFRGLVAGVVAILAVGARAESDLAPHSASENGSPVRGVVKSLKTVSYASELQTPVIKIGAREGHRFKQGQMLVVFDCRRLSAELQALEAAEKEALLLVESNELLAKRSAIGRYDVDISRVRATKASAESEALRTRLEQCAVVAPYDGSVLDLAINEFEQPTPGKVFLTIVGDAAVEIEAIVPSRWLSRLTPGSPFSLTLDETGKTYAARVDRLARAVDAVSQTVKAYGVFVESPPDVLPGMSGTARFDIEGGAEHDQGSP